MSKKKSKKALIVIAHYDEKSFNHALAEQAKKTLEDIGYEVKISDLYKKKFNPVAHMDNFLKVEDKKNFKLNKEQQNRENLGKDVQEEQKLIEWANLIIFQTPIWWFSVPAILKGYFDRVFTSGWAYAFNSWYKTGPMKKKKCFFSITTGGGPNMYQDSAVNGDFKRILYPMSHGILYFCGFRVLEEHICWAVEYVDGTARKEYLAGYDKHLRALKKKKFRYGAK